jgi:hypothetical protein
LIPGGGSSEPSVCCGDPMLIAFTGCGGGLPGFGDGGGLPGFGDAGLPFPPP